MGLKGKPFGFPVETKTKASHQNREERKAFLHKPPQVVRAGFEKLGCDRWPPTLSLVGLHHLAGVFIAGASHPSARRVLWFSPSSRREGTTPWHTQLHPRLHSACCSVCSLVINQQAVRYGNIAASCRCPGHFALSLRTFFIRAK